jgi:hypothetical protein
MQISTLIEATAELTALTGSPWSASKVLDYCSQKLITLCAKISIQEADVESVTRKQPTESLWQSATGFSTYAPLKPEAIWLLRQDGCVKIKHPADGPRSWPVREITVTLEQVWIKADALHKIYASWEKETRLQAKAQAKYRRTWRDVALPYMEEVFKAAQYPTAKDFYRALEKKAGAGSPFDRGTGPNSDSLYVRELSEKLTFKTIQNVVWPQLKKTDNRLV